MDQLPQNTSPLNLKNQSPVSFRRYAHSLDPLLTKPKNRAYTATILSFLVISLFLWYAIRPTLQTILALRREIRDNLQVNQQMEQKISDLVEAQAVYQASAPRQPLLAQALPKNPDAVPLLMSLRNIVSQSNASISAIQIDTVPIEAPEATRPGLPASDTIIINPLTISIDGTYGSIKHFFDSILNMRRIITVDSFTITRADNSITATINPQVRLTIKLNLNYFPGAPYER